MDRARQLSLPVVSEKDADRIENNREPAMRPGTAVAATAENSANPYEVPAPTECREAPANPKSGLDQELMLHVLRPRADGPSECDLSGSFCHDTA